MSIEYMSEKELWDAEHAPKNFPLSDAEIAKHKRMSDAAKERWCKRKNKASDKMRAEYNQGETVWLDKDMSNGGRVKVIRQSSNKLYTTVESEGIQWDVMTYRLSI